MAEPNAAEGGGRLEAAPASGPTNEPEDELVLPGLHQGDDEPHHRRPSEADQNDWRRTRRERRALLRQLPEGLRHDIAKIFRDDLACEFGEQVMERALDIARQRGQTLTIRRPLGFDREVVQPAYLPDILGQLERNPTYRATLRRRINQVLRSEHLVKIDPERESLDLPDDLYSSPPPKSGAWEVEADVGLGTASFLGAEPEGWDLWAVKRTLLRQREMRGLTRPGRRSTAPIRVLVLEAGPGGIARAVAAVAPGDAKVVVEELDSWIARATNLDVVTSAQDGVRYLRVPEPCDAVILATPAPSRGGASNHRAIYRGLSADGRDFWGVGPRQWRRKLFDAVGALRDILTPFGEALLLLPLGVRVDEGYEDAPDLLEGLVEHVQASGLKVVKTITTVELNPTPQPFVDRRRCTWVTMVLHREVQDDDGEVSL